MSFLYAIAAWLVEKLLGGWWAARHPRTEAETVINVAEKQNEILADHTAPDASDSLRDGTF